MNFMFDISSAMPTKKLKEVDQFIHFFFCAIRVN